MNVTYYRVEKAIMKRTFVDKVADLRPLISMCLTTAYVYRGDSIIPITTYFWSTRNGWNTKKKKITSLCTKSLTTLDYHTNRDYTEEKRNRMRLGYCKRAAQT